MAIEIFFFIEGIYKVKSVNDKLETRFFAIRDIRFFCR